MKKRFPEFDPTAHAWINMHDGAAPRIRALATLLQQIFQVDAVPIEVHRMIAYLIALSAHA